MERLSHRLGKRERLSGHKQIDALFGGGSQSVTVYPIRTVYRLSACSEGQPPVRLLVSVPKRHFKHAVDRNLVKRQLREAYRQEKHLLEEAAEEHVNPFSANETLLFGKRRTSHLVLLFQQVVLQSTRHGRILLRRSLQVESESCVLYGLGC